MRSGTPGDIEIVSRVLAQALEDDPLSQWYFPRTASRTVRLRRLLTQSSWSSHRRGGGIELTTDSAGVVTGAALWQSTSHPTKTKSTVGRWLADRRIFGRQAGQVRVARRIRATPQADATSHVVEHHWHLSAIGIRPDMRGLGYGRDLLESGLRRCDAGGVPAHLETSNVDNVPFYERFGFELIGIRDRPEAGPRTWLMRYEPRPPEESPTPSEGERNRTPAKKIASGQPSIGAAVITAPLPPIPPIEEPHAVVVAGPDTASIMGRAAVRRAQFHPLRLRNPAIVVGFLAFMAAYFGGASGFWFVVLGAGIPFGLLVALQGFRGRGIFAVSAAPGTVLASRFGPDSFEIQDGLSRTRIPYGELWDLTVRSDVVVLGVSANIGRAFRAYPRELFPDSMIDLMQAARLGTMPELPPLPPIAPLDKPTATYTAGSTTGADLTRALLIQIGQGTAAWTLVAVEIFALVGAKVFGVDTAVRGALAAVVILTFLFIRYMIRLRRRLLTRSADLDGQLMATRFGPDAFALQTPDAHVRIPYRSLRRMRTRGDTLVLVASIPFALPRALFSELALASIRAAVPRLARQR